MRNFSGLFTLAFCMTFFGALCGPSLAQAGQGPILIVFDMEDRGSGLDAQVLTNLSDYLAVLMAEGGYQVVPRSQVKDRIKQQQLDSKKACYDQSCQVELGRELAAQKSLATQIFKIGGVCRVTASLFDLRKAATEKAASGGGSCEEKELLAAVEQIAKKMAIGSGGKVDAAAKAEKARKEEQARQAAEQARKEKEAEQARQAAQRARKEEQARKAEQARQAAQKARKEEQARTAAEKARKEKQAGQAQKKAVQKEAETTAKGEFDVKRLWWNLTLKFDLLMPGINRVFVEKSNAQGDADRESIDCGLGLNFDLGADFKLGSYLSLGPYVLLAFSDATDSSGSNGMWTYLSFGARVKGRFAATKRFEIRPTFSIGLSIIPYTDNFNIRGDNFDTMPFDGAMGLCLGLSAELAYYLSDSFALLADIGIIGQPLGGGDMDWSRPTQEGGVEKVPTDVTTDPFMLYIGLGLEFGG